MAKYQFIVEAGVRTPGNSQKKELFKVESTNINLNKDQARKVLVDTLEEETGKKWLCDIIFSLKRLK